MEKGDLQRELFGKILISLFYQPSSRTRLSFESAMLQLGGSVIGIENAKEFSSFAKGETLEDSIRVMSEYGDALVLRYHEKGGAERAQKVSNIPIINAGDGPGQHPTQALLDLYTIHKCFGFVEGLNVALVGDLLNGRTVRSLCYFLAKHYPPRRLFLISPEETRMKKDIIEYLKKYNINYIEVEELDPYLPIIDVLYQTRVQKEVFLNAAVDHEDVHGVDKKIALFDKVCAASEKLIIDLDKANKMKDSSIIMHPLPRINEISTSVDNNHRAKYFEQSRNGVFVRMAILLDLFRN